MRSDLIGDSTLETARTAMITQSNDHLCFLCCWVSVSSSNYTPNLTSSLAICRSGFMRTQGHTL